MAGALELVFRVQPVGGAAQTCADRKQRIKAVLLMDDPDPLLLLPPLADGSDGILLRRPALKIGEGSKSTLGNMKRPNAKPPTARAAKIPPHPASEKKSRRDQMVGALSSIPTIRRSAGFPATRVSSANLHPGRHHRVRRLIRKSSRL